MLIKVLLVALSLAAVISTLTILTCTALIQPVKAQQDCQTRKDDLVSRGFAWTNKWETAASDPGGQIRSEGKQISAEIGMILNDCVNSLNDHDKLILTQMATVINAEIDKDVNYGPPCNPSCQPGPPIS